MDGLEPIPLAPEIMRTLLLTPLSGLDTVPGAKTGALEIS